MRSQCHCQGCVSSPERNTRESTRRQKKEKTDSEYVRKTVVSSSDCWHKCIIMLLTERWLGYLFEFSAAWQHGYQLSETRNHHPLHICTALFISILSLGLWNFPHYFLSFSLRSFWEVIWLCTCSIITCTFLMRSFPLKYFVCFYYFSSVVI